MHNELERMLIKWQWPNLRYYPGTYLEGLRNITKASVMTAGLRVEI
jgi:hypothetical protein